VPNNHSECLYLNMVKSNIPIFTIDHFHKGIAWRIQGAREESRVHGKNPGWTERIQGARGEFRVGGANPGCTEIIQGASG
jgi:hypothetical protein